VISPWKLIGYVVLGLLGIAGVFAWNKHKDSQYEAAKAAWQIQKNADDSILGVKTAESYQAGLANAQSVPVYIEGKTKIVHDAAGTPAEAAVKACFALADERISKCEASRKADSATIAALKHDLATTEAKPEPKEPRFVMYGAAGYSVTIAEKETRTAPAFRAGIDTKLLGPIRLTTDAQLTMPGKGKSNPTWQGNLMARINF
jgi:rhodanese-related sulfurtransferase